MQSTLAGPVASCHARVLVPGAVQNCRPSRPSRLRPLPLQRLTPTGATQNSARDLVEYNEDGSVTFHFGISGPGGVQKTEQHHNVSAEAAAAAGPAVEPAHSLAAHNGAAASAAAVPAVEECHAPAAQDAGAQPLHTKGSGSALATLVDRLRNGNGRASVAATASLAQSPLPLEVPASEPPSDHKETNNHLNSSAPLPAPAVAPAAASSGEQQLMHHGQQQDRQQEQQHAQRRRSGSSSSDSASAQLDHLAAEALQYELPPSNGVAAGLEELEELPLDPQAVDYPSAPSGALLRLYAALCERSSLDEALQVVRGCIRANRTEVLMRLKHRDFLRPAARLRAVKQALRFVQLMPRQYVSSRTYNMVVSVCAQARDLKNALHAADMLRHAGLKPDTIFYTNLIKACAAAGDAERAFQLYSEMREAKVATDKQVYCVLVSACSRQIERTAAEDRRTQLVLLERALGVMTDMAKARVQADAAVWNALVGAAGRAGQLQRAFNVVEDMLVHHSKPNSRTYCSLIDACARSGDKELALRVYRKALREGCSTDIQVYSSAVNACATAKQGADVEAAMSIYRDLQRNGVRPDSAFYGVLMRVAGQGGNMEVALDLQNDMEAEGVEPCGGTQSALISIFIRHGRLDEAVQRYRRLRAQKAWPHRHTMNALVNAYANQHRLGDVVSLVTDMVEGGMAPDLFTFTAVITACVKADECELAIEVYKLMKQRGIRLDETLAQLLLWLCCLRLRQEADGAALRPQRAQERARLLQALQPRGRASSRAVEVREPTDIAWLSQAFAIYRDAVNGNLRPSVKVLNYILTCLQVPWQSNKRQEQHQKVPDGLGVLTQVFQPAVPGPASVRQRQQKIGIEKVFHVQAISVVEEAMLSGVVPNFSSDTSKPIDLRGLPPAVASAYACMVINSLQRQVEARHPLNHPIVFLVPPFDPFKVYLPSTSPSPSEAVAAVCLDPLATGTVELIATAAAGDDHLEAAQQAQHGAAANGAAAPAQHQGSGSGEEEEGEGLEEWLAEEYEDDSESSDELLAEYGAQEGEPSGDPRTGLGVAGALRRLRLHTREFGAKGMVVVEAGELVRWARMQARLAESRSAGALPVPKPYGQPQGGGRLQGGRLADQQRSIRLGWKPVLLIVLVWRRIVGATTVGPLKRRRTTDLGVVCVIISVRVRNVISSSLRTCFLGVSGRP